MPVDVYLKTKLEEADQQYGEDRINEILGPTLLTYTNTDSARMYMFTSHLKQALVLLNPEIPRLQTGFENTFGKYSNSFKKLEGTWVVLDIIRKFKNGSIYTIVLYNKKTDTYEMIEKQIAEDLTEKFGYIYNTDKMDALVKGDKITDTILYRSTSFDDNMNYRYGKNARVHYSTTTDTIEDAIVIRRSWAEGVKSIEVDTIQTMLNGNDIPLNLYGEGEEYKAFPDLGDRVKNSIICATRRLNKNHILYDTQRQNMKEIYTTDTEYYSTKDAEVYDINIYYNGDDPFPDNIFYHQLKGYYDEICEYADSVYEWATKIKRSGSKYTKNIPFLRSKYAHYNDPEYKWKNKDKAFANILVTFSVKSVISLGPGAKMTGRYGDKGVISRICDDVVDNVKSSIVDMFGASLTDEEREKLASEIMIVDDERMPYCDEYPIDIELNMSGAIRRLNPAQLTEIETNFIAERLQLMIREMPTMQEKEDVIFKFLSIINEDQAQFFWRLYNSYDQYVLVDHLKLRLMAPGEKERFIKSIEDDGFFLVRPPHKPLLYDHVAHLYKEFPEIKPIPIYVDLFGIKKRRLLRDGIVGFKYMLILKQNSNKNYSARSTFRVNRVNLPAKDITKKTNRAGYAKTPIRLSEIYGLLSSVSGTTLAEYDMLTRSSALGRKSLDRILTAEGNPLALKRIKMTNGFINTNADIVGCKLKCIGVGISFRSDPSPIPDIYDNALHEMRFGQFAIFDTYDKHAMYSHLFYLYQQWMRSNIFIGTYPGEVYDVCWNTIFRMDEVQQYALTDELKDKLILCTKGSMNTDKMTKVHDTLEEDEEPEDGAPVGQVVKKRRGRRPKAVIEAEKMAAAAAELKKEEESN